MVLSYSVTDENIVILKSGTKKINEVGPWDSATGAAEWGAAICEKYNSPEYAKITYPDQLPEDATLG